MMVRAGGGGGGPTPYSLITHDIAQSSSGSSGATTAAKDTTGANLIILVICYDFSRNPGVSDSQSNTWTAGTESIAAPSLRVYISYNPATNAAHTFSVGGGSGGPAFSSIAMLAFSGAGTPTFDQFVDHATSSSTIQTGSRTPTVNNELLVSAVGSNATGSPQSIDSSFIKTDDAAFIGSTAYSLAVAYKIQTTAGAENTTWTMASSGSLVASLSSYFSDL